jgi:hypothetical protein
MTPDQTQGNRMVAEAMGYTIRQVCELWHIWLPGVSTVIENSIRTNGGPRYTLEDLMAAHFPLFAPARQGGAAVREEARNWLVRQGWYYTFQGTNGDDVIQVWLRKDDTCAPISVLAFDRGEGWTTIVEAEAAAITAAAKAMLEEGGK